MRMNQQVPVYGSVPNAGGYFVQGALPNQRAPFVSSTMPGQMRSGNVPRWNGGIGSMGYGEYPLILGVTFPSSSR